MYFVVIKLQDVKIKLKIYVCTGKVLYILTLNYMSLNILAGYTRKRIHAVNACMVCVICVSAQGNQYIFLLHVSVCGFQKLKPVGSTDDLTTACDCSETSPLRTMIRETGHTHTRTRMHAHTRCKQHTHINEHTWRLKGLEHEIHCVISSPAEKPEDSKLLCKHTTSNAQM